MTLDEPFFKKQSDDPDLQRRRKWPEPQHPKENRKLFTESKSITYLENEAATIYLNAKGGPQTCFKVYGSPCTPNNRNWAFGYPPGTAQELWDTIPLDTDIVVTHTPPLGHCDMAVYDERTGCKELSQALRRVRPMLSVFGHIHEARGVERVRWNLDASAPANECPTESVEIWEDPGIGKKQSTVDLSARGGRRLENGGRLTRQIHDGGVSLLDENLGRLPDILGGSGSNDSTSHEGVTGEATGRVKVMLGGAIECRQGTLAGGIGLGQPREMQAEERRETVMINAAFCGPHHLKTVFNKPIVVDVDLPVWTRCNDAG